MDYPVEIKSNVEPATIDAALDILGLDDSKAEHKTIYFLETSTQTERLALHAEGVILRLRLSDEGSDCTLKFRPCDPDRLPGEWSAHREGSGWEFGVEQDWSGVTPSLSASLTTDVDGTVGEKAVESSDLSPIMSTNQLDLFNSYTSQTLVTADLRPLGPISARKWKLKASDTIDLRVLGHKIHVEEWTIGHALRFLELSGREDDMPAAKATRRDLAQLWADLKISISTTPELKTKIVLDHFSRAKDH